MPGTQTHQPPVAPAPALPAREATLARLASATVGIAGIASALHGSPLVLPAAQDAFWHLREHALRVSLRFDGAWTRLCGRAPPTEARLDALLEQAEAAVQALEAARSSPTDSRVLAALTAGATSLDRTDGMFDGLGA